MSGHRVQLVVSALGGIPGAKAYHSSVLVDGEEFSFSDGGICKAPQGPASHQGMQQTKTIDMGTSPKSSADMLAALECYFAEGTYDILRKNCNAFSDVALYYLVQRRLGAEYKTLERLGTSCAPLIQAVSGGQYSANPLATGFKSEAIVQELSSDRQLHTPAGTTGGAAAVNPESLRAARIARLEALQSSRQGPASASLELRNTEADGAPGEEHASDEEFARRLQFEQESDVASLAAFKSYLC